MSPRTIRTLVVIVLCAALGAVLITPMVLPTPTADEQAQTDAATLPGETGNAEAGPEVFYDAPAFTLTDQAGEPFSHEALAGKVWIADFIFTRCTSICPVMTAKMAELRDQLSQFPHSEDVRLVSVSVEPEHDQPAVLAEYAAKFKADRQQWRFLTGDRMVIWPLIEMGFKLPVGIAPEDPDMPIGHSPKFVLVDRAGKIRGYYNALMPDDRQQLRIDLQKVLLETGAE